MGTAARIYVGEGNHTMWHAEPLALQKLASVLDQSGASHADAQLFIEEGRDIWYVMHGGSEPLSRRLLAACYGAGLRLYACDTGLLDGVETAETANAGSVRQTDPNRTYVIGGSRANWRTLLAQWPDDAATVEAGKTISGHTGYACALRPATYVAGRPMYWGERTYVMGILNVTPDSFSDGGCYLTIQDAVERGRQMLAAGADIIDVGGESTRPGSLSVSAAEECKRVLPVIKALVNDLGATVSIDTNKAAVAREAVAAGAAIVNDVTGLRGDPAMARTVAKLNVPVVIMHIQGTPRDMQLNPRYESVVPDVMALLKQSADEALAAGVTAENIILDPGFGFGKNLQHNTELLQRLASVRRLGYPVLSGTSRKSMIGALLNAPVDQRLDGTAATVALSVAALADIVRVHDVAAMSRVVRVSDAIVRPFSGHISKDG